MNDATPRRFTGSLIERAAARYDFATPPVVMPEANCAPVCAEPVEAPSFSTPLVTEALRPARRPRRVANRTGIVDRDRLIEQGLLVPGGPVTGLAEEFRIVKRQLKLAGDAGDAKARRILICSAQPGDGKTFCAINLALSMAAEKNVEVVLIDADFAKAEIPVLLGIDGGTGLLDAIADPAMDIEAAVIRTDIPQLSVLSAGTRSHDDTELLASDRTAVLLDTLQANDPRRILIFDSPPALAASPASTLAHRVGHVLLVVRADRTPENELREAVALLDGCDDIRLLLNAARFAPGGKRFGSYYGYGSE